MTTVTQSRRTPLDRTALLFRSTSVAILLAALAAILWMVMPLLAPTTRVIEDTVGDATFFLEVDRLVLLPGQCATVTWAVEGVQAVYFHHLLSPQQGVTGAETREVCPAGDSVYRFHAELPDGQRPSYTFDLLVMTPQLMAAFGLSVVLLGGAALTIFRPMLAADRTRALWVVHGLAVGLMLVLTVGLYATTRHLMPAGDTLEHMSYAYALSQGASFSSPHFLYQLFLLGTVPFLPGNDLETFFEAGFWVYHAMNLLTVGLIYGFFCYVAGLPKTFRRAVGYALLAVALQFISAITFLTLPARNLYEGYFPNVAIYHNPTIVVLKPFSVLLFWLAVLLLGKAPRRVLRVGASMIVTVLCLLAKPNYVIILIPALGLFLLWELWRTRRINWSVVIGVFVPALPILLAQYLAFFTGGEEAAGQLTQTSRVIFAPLEVMLIRDSRLWMLGLKLLFSVAFPLSVYLSYPDERNQAANLALLSFGVGLLYTLLLAEEGWVAHGNFIWSAQIGLFIWFMVSVATFLRVRVRENVPLWNWNLSLLVLHITSGLIWHTLNVTPDAYAFLWW